MCYIALGMSFFIANCITTFMSKSLDKLNMGNNGKGFSTSTLISSSPTKIYDKKVTMTRMPTVDCIPCEFTNANGKNTRKRQSTLEVILVKVGGIGDALILLQAPIARSKSPNFSSMSFDTLPCSFPRMVRLAMMLRIRKIIAEGLSRMDCALTHSTSSGGNNVWRTRVSSSPLSWPLTHQPKAARYRPISNPRFLSMGT
mmetsp:Transcript_18037/g.29152  ORF Transcript_18037/g.29152 Transcript_18037/m.29152 type:complete len:200 (-) Transcript_18037:316-915(-)